jgi:hypothetical protein
MRKSRSGMVQTEGQYIFIHRVLEDIVREKQLKGVTGKRNSALHLSWDSFGASSEDSNTDTASDSSSDPEEDPCLSDSNSSNGYPWYTVTESRSVVLVNP